MHRKLTMKLYSQMGVSSSRNSPYFLYKSYVTCGAGRRVFKERSRGAAGRRAAYLVAAAVVPHVFAHHHHRGVALKLLRCAVGAPPGRVQPRVTQP